MQTLRSYERTYSEMMQFETFGDRLRYLQLLGSNYPSPRSVSNTFYRGNPLWLRTREEIIERDMASDLGIIGMLIKGSILVHHINPITEEDIANNSDKLYDPENLITVSYDTHNKIHYIKRELEVFQERRRGDTALW